MMPFSRRVPSSPFQTDAAQGVRAAGGARLRAVAAALARANSSSVAIGAAAGFLLLSTALSAVPEGGSAIASPSYAALGLRGTIESGAD